MLGALAAWGVRRRRELLMPVVWLGLWLLPVLNLWMLPRQWMVTDRYLFLPSLALPWLLALLLLNDGRPEPARAALRRAVALDPTSAASMTRLAELELASGDVAAAEGLFRRALLIDPADSRGLKRIAIALARRGQRQRAYAVAAEAAHRWPADFESQLLHALFLEAAGQPRQAEVFFARARRLRPGDPAVAEGLANLAARLLPAMFPNG